MKKKKLKEEIEILKRALKSSDYKVEYYNKIIKDNNLEKLFSIVYSVGFPFDASKLNFDSHNDVHVKGLWSSTVKDEEIKVLKKDIDILTAQNESLEKKNKEPKEEYSFPSLKVRLIDSMNDVNEFLEGESERNVGKYSSKLYGKPIDKVTTDRLGTALKLCDINILTSTVDKIIDVVELIEDKGGSVSFDDLIELQNDWPKK